MLRLAGVGPGDVIDGRYRVEAVLANGSRTCVVSAVHVPTDKRCAIKLLDSEHARKHPASVRRFAQEARLCAMVASDHVVGTLDFGVLPDGGHYHAMELLAGHTLAASLEHGPLDPVFAVEYLTQVCEGLTHVHALGIVHRDLRPANLFVASRPGAAPIVKLISFGIAQKRVVTVEATPSAPIGTPSYMSPEQWNGKRDVDARSDIWSLGITLYELLAGRVPFQAPSLAALVVRIADDTHAPLQAIPRALAAIVDRCLAKDRDARYQSVTEIAGALAAVFQ